MNQLLRLRPLLACTILECLTLYSYSALAHCRAKEQALPTAAECIDLLKPFMNKKNNQSFRPKTDTTWLGVGQAVPNALSMMAVNSASCLDVLEARYIPSSAMAPTLQREDRLFIAHIPHFKL